MEQIVPRKGARNLTNVVVSGSAVRLALANPNRKSITFQNQGSATVFLGGPTVTASGGASGYALFAGTTFCDNATDGEWWAISGGTANNVNVMEVL
jgi:hypothetical protein